MRPLHLVPANTKIDFVGKNIPTSRAEKVVLRQAPGGEYEVVVI